MLYCKKDPNPSLSPSTGYIFEKKCPFFIICDPNSKGIYKFFTKK